MLHRALAVAAAIAVPLLIMIPVIARLHPAMVWVGPTLAALLAIPIVLRAGESRTQAVVGAALAAMAAGSSPEVPELLALTSDAGPPVHDLREGPIPDAAEGYVAVEGYLRREWVVDEYQVAQGERPDQNEEAPAVLLPLVGTDADVIELDPARGRVIVARVRPERVRGPALVTLRGQLAPVSPEIVESLFVIELADQARAGDAPAPQPRGVMLDTLDMPTRGQAITRAALAGGAAVLGLVLLLFSLPASRRRGSGARAHEETRTISS